MPAFLTPLTVLSVIMAGLVLHAAWTDIRLLVIRNQTSLCVFVCSLARLVLEQRHIGLADLGVWAGVGAAAFAAHIFLKVGAGDVKFVWAVLPWFHTTDIGAFLIVSALYGGLLSIAAILAIRLRQFDPWGATDRVFPFLAVGKCKQIPYGVAMAAAVLTLIAAELGHATAIIGA